MNRQSCALSLIVSVFISTKICIRVEFYRRSGSRKASRGRLWHIPLSTALSGSPLMPPAPAGAQRWWASSPGFRPATGTAERWETEGEKVKMWDSANGSALETAWGDFGVRPRGLQLHRVQSSRGVFTWRGENGCSRRIWVSGDVSEEATFNMLSVRNVCLLKCVSGTKFKMSLKNTTWFQF